MPHCDGGLCERKLGPHSGLTPLDPKPCTRNKPSNFSLSGRRPRPTPGGAWLRQDQKPTRARRGRAQARSRGDVRGCAPPAGSRLAGAFLSSVLRSACAGASPEDGGSWSGPSQAGGLGPAAAEPAPTCPGTVGSGPALSQEGRGR